jgi:hypothetical protein
MGHFVNLLVFPSMRMAKRQALKRKNSICMSTHLRMQHGQVLLLKHLASDLQTSLKVVVAGSKPLTDVWKEWVAWVERILTPDESPTRTGCLVCWGGTSCEARWINVITEVLHPETACYQNACDTFGIYCLQQSSTQVALCTDQNLGPLG